jgi:hypothetical protein
LSAFQEVTRGSTELTDKIERAPEFLNPPSAHRYKRKVRNNRTQGPIFLPNREQMPPGWISFLAQTGKDFTKLMVYPHNLNDFHSKQCKKREVFQIFQKLWKGRDFGKNIAP